MGETAFIRMSDAPAGLRVAQVVGLTSTAFLAGRTFTQTFSATPALLHAPAALLAKQWKTMFDRDKHLAAPIIFYSTGLFAWLAWRDRTAPTRSTLFQATAALASFLTIPYSLLFLEPLTQKLESKAVDLKYNAEALGLEREETTHWLVDRWATVNLGRAALLLVAAASGTWAGLGGVSTAGVSVVTGADRMGE